MSIRTAALGLAMLLLAGCGGTASSPAPDQDPVDGRVSVVASTNVYGSIVSAVGGDRVRVTTLIDDPAADPHSYESTPAGAAAVAGAQLVVYNGGGYDHWVDDALSGHPKTQAVNTYSLLPSGQPQPANEHVFYDPSTAKAVATQIADRLAQADAANADTYRANAAEFGKKADDILQTERAIGQSHPGTSVVATEPVAHYLLVNAGITDKTPEGFSSAIEEDADPSPADLAAMLDLINKRQVSAVLFNAQTQTAVTKQIQDAAQKASVPVVTVTETLPQGTDYLSWQRQTADQLANALQTNR